MRDQQEKKSSRNYGYKIFRKLLLFSYGKNVNILLYFVFIINSLYLNKNLFIKTLFPLVGWSFGQNWTELTMIGKNELSQNDHFN